MTGESLEHRIRAALGRAFHHKHQSGTSTVDIEHIAQEHGVSEDQVMEQFDWLRSQNLIRGPLTSESGQIQGVPGSRIHEHHLTDEGLDWAMRGYPYV